MSLLYETSTKDDGIIQVNQIAIYDKCRIIDIIASADKSVATTKNISFQNGMKIGNVQLTDHLRRATRMQLTP
jgi:hypothetical protein